MLTREEFLLRYRDAPHGVRAERVDGMVIMNSASVYRCHSRSLFSMTTLLALYEMRTSGVDGGTRQTTSIGGDEAGHGDHEVEPDSFLLIDGAHGGRVRFDDEGIMLGAPEFVVEVACSSAAYDLSKKRDLYEAAGVEEYLVVLPERGEMVLFRRPEAGAAFVPQRLVEGRIEVTPFPGLWLDAAAILTNDSVAALATLNAGLESPEHAAFVDELAARTSDDE